MSAAEIISELKSLGVDLWVDAGQLRFRAPEGLLTEERRATLRAAKAEIVELLAEERDEVALTPDPAAWGEPFPLTDVQTAYLLGRRDPFGYGGVACHGYLEVTYPELDPVRLEDAWNILVERHDMLHAVIEQDGYQRVLPQVPRCRVAVADLRGAPAERVAAGLEEVRAELGHRVYRTDEWPLFELRITHTGDGDVLHISIDSLIADWASAGVLLAELDALLADPAATLPPLDIRFRDYLLAERRLRETARYRRDRDHWFGRVDELPPAPELPIVTGAGQGGPARFRRHHIRLPAPQWSRFIERSRERGVTPAAGLMAAYAAVLRLWSRHPDFTVNLTLLNRLPLHPQVDRLVGDFTSVSLLAVEPGDDLTFGEQASRIAGRLFADLDHRLCSGVEVMREIARRRGREAALMPIVFTSGIGVGPGVRPAGGGRAGYGITQTPQVFIDCQVADDDEGLEVNWDVREGIFPAGLVEDMFAAMESLLFALADSGSDAAWRSREPVAFPPRQAEERLRANATVVPLPEGLLHHGVLRQAERTPEATAVIGPAGALSYDELVRRASAVADALRTEGAVAGERVAVVMDKGVEQVIAVLGVLLAGAAYLPVDTTQPRLRRDRLLRDGGAVRVLTQSWVSAGTEWPEGTRVIRVDMLPPAPARPEIERPEIEHGDPGALAYVIYTSGSTGHPKGVMISHRAALNTVADINRRFGVTAADRVLGVAQLGFDLSVYDIFGPLSLGAALVLPDPGRRADPSHWARLIGEHGVTVWNSVPAQMGMLVDYLETEDPGERAGIGSLRLGLLSGDWIPVTLPARVRPLAPGMSLISLGGATEAAIWSIFHPIEDVDPAWTSVPYGRPLANQGFHVLDAAMRDVPVWVPGELYISGDGLAQGYLGDAELTAARFVTHPGSGERLYRTGDLGRYLPGGEIEFLGREDDQVKIRGHRIELGEVEAAMLTHPGVGAAAAVVSGDPRADRILLGFAVPAHTSNHEDESGGDGEGSGADAAVGAREGVAVASAVRRFAAGQAEGLDADRVAEHVRLLHDASLAAMMNVLCERGAFAGDPVTADDVLRAARVHERHHWLVRQWLTLLADAGRLVRDPASRRYIVRRPVGRSEVEEAWRLVERQCALGMCTPDFVRYHRAHVERLDALLEDEQSPFDLLFPEGRMELAHAVYRDDSIARYLNGAAAATLREIAAARGGGRRLRVLEVGAGTGAATAAMLPALDGFAAEYLFTDVTPFFLQEARERFGGRPWVRFGVFDIDGDPRAQGLTPNSFDVVLAAGVLNSARDPRHAVAMAAELLAPGGWLVFTEPTADLPHILLTQGFMMDPDGGDRRQGRTTLLSREEWTDAIAAAGGEAVLCLPADDEPLTAQGMHVFAARFKTDRHDLRTDELAGFLAERLPAHMIPAQLQLVDTLPVTGNGKIDRRALAGWRPATAGWTAAREHDSLPDDLAARLGRMWADALGLPEIGVEENFYDHGADSLVLARMAGRLREEVPEASGVAYDTLLRQMLNEPTVAALARALREHPDDPGTTGTGAAPGAWRGAHGNALLVPFGGGPEGPARVLFHAALGTMDYFQSLARELVAQDLGPVVGVAVADVEEYCAIEPRQLVGRVADDYAESLIAEGFTRFQLIGYCLGGLLATEVGRRLLERGAEVTDLTLVDSIPMFVETDEELAYESIFVPNLGLDPVAAVFGEEVNAADVYRGIEMIMAEHGGRVPAGAMARLGGDPGLAAVAAAAGARTARSQEERLAAYAKASSEQAGVPIGPELVPGLFRVCRHSMMAARFDPEPYAGDITFLRATEAQSFGITAGVTHLTATFWKDICLGEFRLVDVVGNHFSVIEPPHLSTVAEHLAAPLRARSTA